MKTAALADNILPTSIHGVWRLPLKQIPTAGGPVLHMMRRDNAFFTAFGEVYFSVVEPGAVKAWKCHTEQTQYLTVPSGQASFVLYDERQTSPTSGILFECTLGRPEHYQLLCIPPGIWYGFSCCGPFEALVANCADQPHCPTESMKRELTDPRIPYYFQSQS